MEEHSRKKKSLKNIIIALFSNVLIYGLSLFTSKVIKENLGLQVLGLNGVLSNVIGMLGITELGIGSAITFALYKPLADDNKELIKSIMAFYKKAYIVVALIIFIIGMILFPFVPVFVKDSSFSKPYIWLVYSLFLFNSVISYFLVYKRTLIVADQKNYIITTATLIYNYALKIGQLLIVIFTSNYILFLSVQIVFTIIYNIIVCVICDRIYPYLKEPSQKMPKELNNLIISKIKALFWHSLASIIVLGTDNILVSVFCGIETTGKYTSYYSIIFMISTFIGVIFDNLKDSAGNFLTTESVEKKNELFDNLLFMNHTLDSVCGICLILLLTPFINMWLGSDTVLPQDFIIILVFNFYLQKNRSVIGVFKNSAGLFEQDKYVPIIESFLNLGVSIILAKVFGLKGVTLGTIISTLLIPFWVQPLIVCRHILNRNFFKYLFQYFCYFVRTIGILILSLFIMKKINFMPSNFWDFFVEATIVFISVLACWMISVCYKKETKYFVKLVLGKIIKNK